MNSIRSRPVAETVTAVTAFIWLLWSSPTFAWHAHWGMPLVIGNGVIENNANTPFPISYADLDPETPGGSQIGNLRGLDIRFSVPDVEGKGYRRITIKVSAAALDGIGPREVARTKTATSGYKILIPTEIAAGMESTFALDAYVRMIGHGHIDCYEDVFKQRICTSNHSQATGTLRSIQGTGFVNTALLKADPADNCVETTDSWQCRPKLTFEDMQSASQQFAGPGYEVTAFSRQIIPIHDSPLTESGTKTIEWGSPLTAHDTYYRKTLVHVESPPLIAGSGSQSLEARHRVCDGAWLVVDMEAIAKATALSTIYDGSSIFAASELVLTVTLHTPTYLPASLKCPAPLRQESLPSAISVP